MKLIVPFFPHNPSGRTIAPVLAVWLSGAFCLLMCATVCTKAEPTPSHTRRCCAESARIEAEESGSCTVAGVTVRPVGGHEGCCFLSSRPTIKAPVSDTRITPAPPIQARSFEVLDAPVVHIVDSGADLPRSRGDTHVRNCVFLI